MDHRKLCTTPAQVRLRPSAAEELQSLGIIVNQPGGNPIYGDRIESA